MLDLDTEALAVSQLSRDFPKVPVYILTYILASYVPRTANIADAIEQAHVRIVDACAA